MRKEVSKIFIQIWFKIFYKNSRTNVKSLYRVKDFNIGVGVYQGLTLSPYLFSVIMDKITKEIQDEI
jgi:hypothetical protein